MVLWFSPCHLRKCHWHPETLGIVTSHFHNLPAWLSRTMLRLLVGHRQPPLSRGCASSWAPVPGSPGPARRAFVSQSHTVSGTAQLTAAQPRVWMVYGVTGTERSPVPSERRSQWTVHHSSPLPRLEAIQLSWGFSYSQLSDFSFPELLSN